MSAVLARPVALWKWYGPVAADFAKRHWRGLSVVLLAIVAALAMRGCVAERSRAVAAEAQAGAERAQLQAQFDGALRTVRGLSLALSSRADAAQKAGDAPAAVFAGESAPVRVPGPKPPAAPDSAIGPPAASAGPSLCPLCPLCALAIGDEVTFKLRGIDFKRRDGAHYVLADVALDGPGGEVVAALVEAPVTLPPQEVPAPIVEVLRARWAVRAGIVTPWSPSGGYLGGGVRTFGGLWLELDGRATKAEQSVGAGLRVEW